MLRIAGILFSLLVLSTGPATSVLATPLSPATDKNPKPEDPFFVGARTTFDCSARDTLDLYPGFAAGIPDSNTVGENNLPGYSCRNWNEQGVENIYRLEIDQGLQLFAALRHFEDPAAMPEEDFDIFLLGDCDTDSCLVGENLEFSVNLDPGTYYLVVDGFGGSNPATGFYTLLLECREPGLPLQICTEGGATPVAPGTGTISLTGNLFQKPNLMQNFECSTIIERGGEIWYAVTVAGHHEFTATTTMLAGTLDAALWLFDGCGPDAQCLDFADDKLAGEAESLTWANDTDDTVTVYLGLDCYREPAYEDISGVTIEFQGTSNVPTARQSLGSLRALYR